MIDKTDGKPRRNPYRNQIDYILTRRKHMCFVEDSRSYGGTTTSSDHKMVISKLKLKWWKMRKMITKTFKTKVPNDILPGAGRHAVARAALPASLLGHNCVCNYCVGRICL